MTPREEVEAWQDAVREVYEREQAEAERRRMEMADWHRRRLEELED